MQILLVEPGYKNKYPPLGLMKISTYHKLKGDSVTFVKGKVTSAQERIWDRVYISTVFTFHFDLTASTINYYKYSCSHFSDIFVGGVCASLMPSELYEATGIHPICGLLDKPGILDPGDPTIIDELIPDYSLLDEAQHRYSANDAYFGYFTRGCIRHCEFCAVPKLEPIYKPHTSLKDNVEQVSKTFGLKKDLLLLDNNVLASDSFDSIIDEIKELGFSSGSTFIRPNRLEFLLSKANGDLFYSRGYIVKNITDEVKWLFSRTSRFKNVRKMILESFEKHGIDFSKDIDSQSILDCAEDLLDIHKRLSSKAKALRSVDFNQGIDARLLDEHKMSRLSEIAISPLRLAFDDIKYEQIYVEKVHMAVRYGVTRLSNYILYNFHDTPEDFYRRLQINVELNEELGCKIYSFPMRYAPIFQKNRHHIGEHWNKRYLKSLYKILNVSNGIVAPGKEFFYKAFGSNIEEFYELLHMPEDYLLNRFARERDGSIDSWRKSKNLIPEKELHEVEITILNNGILQPESLSQFEAPESIEFLRHYDIKPQKAMVQEKLTLT